MTGAVRENSIAHRKEDRVKGNKYVRIVLVIVAFWILFKYFSPF